MRWNLALAGLAASWGFVAVLVAAVDLGAEALAFWRLALATATLAAAALAVRRPEVLAPGPALRPLVLVGLLQGAHWLLFFEAIDHGSVALAVLTFYTAPLVIALAAPLVLPERTSVLALGAALVGAVGVAGMALDDAGGGVSAAALAAGLGSAVTYAALVVLSRRLLLAATPPATVAFWACLTGTVVVAPALLAAGRVVPVGAGEWAAVLALGIVFTGLSSLAYAFLLRRVTAQTAGVLTFLEPVAAVLLAWGLLEERPGAPTLLGGLLVLLAGAVVVMRPAPAGGTPRSTSIQ